MTSSALIAGNSGWRQVLHGRGIVAGYHEFRRADCGNSPRSKCAREIRARPPDGEVGRSHDAPLTFPFATNPTFYFTLRETDAAGSQAYTYISY
jgi:hypothetical protein